MHRANIYNYVLDSLSNILNNGLEYYKDKDQNLYNELEQISKYIKDKSIIEEDKKIVVSKKNIANNIPDFVINDLEKFINRMAQINIDVLNIQSNKSLYYEDCSINKIGEPLNEQDDEIVEPFISSSIEEDTNTIEISVNEQEEQTIPPKKSILDIFKW